MTKNGKLNYVKPCDRLNLQLFSSLTHNSVPVTETADINLIEADVSMNSGGPIKNIRMGILVHTELWEKYLREMSPFYFNMLSEYLEAVVGSQIDYEPEDVHILKDLGHLYAVSIAEVETR